MAVAWTDEQKKVIDLRDRNILVAAAAGSGKTAVLVERILSRITDPEDPVSVDELLIVTFTKAAAAQMRDRIGQALRKRLEETPENIHLQRQLTLLHYAQITTIDSFCNHVVRSHFDELDMDPDFRIGDEGELKLIRGDLIRQLLEDHYAADDPEFYEFVEMTATGKTDQGLEEWIEKLYFFVSAHPFPKQTLLEWADENAAADGERKTPDWFTFLLEQLHREADELITQYNQAIRLAMSAGGPAAYVDMFVNDRELAQAVGKAKDYDSLQRALEGLVFTRKPTIRDKSVDAELKEMLSAFRDERKKAVLKWKEHYSFPEEKEMLRQMQVASRPLRTLCRLTAEFMERFDAYKKEKHLLDFSDLEHLALQILVTEEDGKIVPSAVARQMQNSYREVMIDEYQDSNLVQEMLLGSVAGHWRGQPNQFMVGDVKQSIYKFRMARPEIFMEKYASYTTEDSTSQKIDLHKNFRSRGEVLDAANFVFRQIMAKSLGGIDYDDQSALYVGASFPVPEGMMEKEEEETAPQENNPAIPKKNYDYTTELMLVDLADDDGYRKDIDPKEAEAKAIAARIRQLTDPRDGLQIWDGHKKKYRTARYGDIVILLRTFSGWADTFVNVLLNAGIPAFAQSSTGYFTALEVQTVLNCLRVLDNPMQDIPFASVMHSQIGDFSSEEMAQMQAIFRKAGCPGGVRGMYGACLYLGGQIAEEDPHFGESVALSEDTSLGRKAAAFLQKIQDLRRKSMYLSLHELLQHVYDDTGYYELVSIMPDGAVRRANLDMLIEKAIGYESTSYYGLFDFVRYIENLHKYDIDFGEAVPDGESGDTVRITTIHKSKGLEFPVVFVAGCGKSFNQQDSHSKILMHPDLGLASDYVDTELRLRATTLKKRVLARKLSLDNLGEELRVLYVAMTRAKEKLILTGTDKALRRKLDKQNTLVGWPMEALPSTMVAGAGSYLDWFLMCLGRANSGWRPWGENATAGTSGESEPIIRQEIVHYSDLFVEEIETQMIRHETRRQLEQWDPSVSYDEQVRKEMMDRLQFVYPWQQDESLPVKVSVSELKHAAMDEDPESCKLVPLEGEQALVPRFLQKEQKLDGASRGTVYHLAMEKMNFTDFSRWGQVGDDQALESQLASWREEGLFTQEEIDAIDRQEMMIFAASPTMERMGAATAAGLLYQEKPFVMGLPAHEIYPDNPSDELVVIQGIIDVYWQEGDGLILLDYKTDKVFQKDGEEVLIRRYKTQLDLYAKALEAAVGMPVKEKLIYSFTLNKLIVLE